MDSKTFFRDDGADASEPLTVRGQQAADMLGISQSTLDRLRKKGRIPFVKLDGAVLYRVASLEQFLLQAEQRLTPDTA
jgi:excisionase family DNA binding protein